MEYQSQAKGLDPVLLEMHKHLRWRSAVRDIRALCEMMDEDRASLGAMGSAARASAIERYSRERQTDRVIDFYYQISSLLNPEH